MIRYSHVSLMIFCKDRSEADLISELLGAQPSRIRADKPKRWSQEEGHSELSSCFWILDSPKSAEADDPTALAAWRRNLTQAHLSHLRRNQLAQALGGCRI